MPYDKKHAQHLLQMHTACFWTSTTEVSLITFPQFQNHISFPLILITHQFSIRIQFSYMKADCQIKRHFRILSYSQ